MTTVRPTVVILLSDKRSGSTMLQDELCKHADIAHVRYSSHTYFETQHWLKAAALLGMHKRFFAGGQMYPAYRTKRSARTYLLDTIRENVPGFDAPNDDRALAFEGWEALCKEFAKPVFFEKSPQYPANWAALSLLLDWAARTKFEAKFVFLFRNPQAVQYSATKLFETEPEQRQLGWVEGQRNLLAMRAMLSPDQHVSIRYEDILMNPQSSFDVLCDFIGVARDPELGRSVSSRSLNKWKEDPSFTLRLAPEVEQMAVALGYTPEELFNPNGVESDFSRRRSVPARFRRSLARLRNAALRPIKLRMKV